jgi:hypothetical protein
MFWLPPWLSQPFLISSSDTFPRRFYCLRSKHTARSPNHSDNQGPQPGLPRWVSYDCPMSCMGIVTPLRTFQRDITGPGAKYGIKHPGMGSEHCHLRGWNFKGLVECPSPPTRTFQGLAGYTHSR